MRLQPLRSSATDAAINLSIEEFLLERTIKGESILLLYVDDACVVVGRNQNPWVEAALSPELPVFRRLSGGGAVWHDRGNLNWALLVPRADHDQEAELALVAAAVSSLGVEVLPGPRGGLFAGPSSALPGAKLSGTARRLASAGVLHHGTLLVESDLGELAAALGGIEASASRALPSIPSRVANLADLVPGLDLEAAAAGLARALCGAEPEAVEPILPPGVLEASIARHRSWDWVRGETPAFAYEPAGPRGLRAGIRRGLVESLEGPGSEALRSLLGSPFEPSLFPRRAPPPAAAATAAAARAAD